MKVICEGIDLSEAVFKVIKACASRTTVPVMECIKISAKNDTVTLTATDGEIAIQKSIKAEVCEEGDICVPGRFFGDFIKKLEGVQITLASETPSSISSTPTARLLCKYFPPTIFLKSTWM